MFYSIAVYENCQGKCGKIKSGHREGVRFYTDMSIVEQQRKDVVIVQKQKQSVDHCTGPKNAENAQNRQPFSVRVSHHVVADELGSCVAVRITSDLRGANRRLGAVDRAAFGTAIVLCVKVLTAFCTQHTDPFLSLGSCSVCESAVHKSCESRVLS